VSLVVIPIYSTATTVVMCPADRPPAGNTVSLIMHHFQLCAVLAPPSIVKQLVEEPEALKRVKHHEFSCVLGSAISYCW
jgi:hypothetical protein